MKIYTFVLLGIVMAVSGCSKKAKQLPSSYIVNKNAYDINVDIYAVYDGPGIATDHVNRLYHVAVPANGVFDAGKLKLAGGGPLLYDWYSTDYRHSDWMFRRNEQYSWIGCGVPLNITVSSTEKGSNERAVCLSGDGKTTHWATVDGYDLDGNSIWETLSSAKHHNNITIAFSATLRDPDFEYGSYCADTGLRCGFHMSDSDRIWLYTADGYAPDIVLTNNADFISGDFTTSSNDTLFYITRYTDAKGKVYYRPPVYKIAKVKTDYFQLVNL